MNATQYPPVVGTEVWLQDDILFGPVIPLRVWRVFKNGWLIAKSDDLRTTVKVEYYDVHTNRPSREHVRKWVDAL